MHTKGCILGRLWIIHSDIRLHLPLIFAGRASKVRNLCFDFRPPSPLSRRLFDTEQHIWNLNQVLRIDSWPMSSATLIQFDRSTLCPPPLKSSRKYGALKMGVKNESIPQPCIVWLCWNRDVVSVLNVSVSRRFLERLGLVSVLRVWKNGMSRPPFGIEGWPSRSCLGLVT